MMANVCNVSLVTVECLSGSIMFLSKVCSGSMLAGCSRDCLKRFRNFQKSFGIVASSKPI